MSKTIQQEQTRNTLAIFVYGTLKRGYWNHDRFCRDAIHIEEAEVRGRLYELHSGIPALQVPDGDVIVVGSSDPVADVVLQWRTAADMLASVGQNTDDWQMIQGELIHFADPRLHLPSIDRLEGLRPGLPGLYRRVLVPVFISGDQSVPAWCYVAGEYVDLHSLSYGGTSWPR